MHTLSIIIPCFNEAKTIGQIVKRVFALYPDCELIVVDDGSADDTAKQALAAGAVVYQHPYNIGNGAAIKTGIRKASGDVLVFMDADGQHAPGDIERLLEHLPAYDMVVGARKAVHQASFLRRFGNSFYNLLATYVAKFPILDLTSGFRAAKAEVMNKLMYMLPNTYSYPTTSTMYVLRTGRTLKYVPINVRPRQSGQSQIKIFRDGIRFFLIIVKICTLFSPFRVFLPISGVFFGTSVLYYLFTYFTTGRFTNMGALLLMTSVLIFMIGLVSEQISSQAYQKSEIDTRECRVEKL
jgi:glycosyltransferase involved in cell wall biosynthesis